MLNARTFDARLTGRKAAPVRPMLASAVELFGREWKCTVRLDQGREGACVGFGAAHAAACVGVQGITDAVARFVYSVSQARDKFPGFDYDGSDLYGGMEAGRCVGWWPEYRECFTEAEIAEAIAEIGPVVATMRWTSGMSETDAEGRIHPTGETIGVHCVCLNGLADRDYLGINSWGRDWGINGGFVISRDDLRMLMLSGGQAAVPIVKRRDGR